MHNSDSNEYHQPLAAAETGSMNSHPFGASVFTDQSVHTGGQESHDESPFPPSLPEGARNTKLTEQATIAMLCERLNTQTMADTVGSGPAPPACRIHSTDEYTEVVVFDPLTCKTHSFKAELVVDVTMAYPLTLAGSWWARGGWQETQAAVNEAEMKQRRRQATLTLGFGWNIDVLVAIAFFVLMVGIVEISAPEQPFIFAFVGVCVAWVYAGCPWGAFSLSSAVLLALTIAWSSLRFALENNSCSNSSNSDHKHDNTTCTSVHFMCLKECDGDGTSKGGSRSCDDEWARCDGVDKKILYAVLFNLFFFLVIQLNHHFAFGSLFAQPVCPPGECDPQGFAAVATPGGATLKQVIAKSPRITVTVRHIDAGSLIVRRATVAATVFHASIQTYEALQELCHNREIQKRKLALLSSLASVDTNPSDSSFPLGLFSFPPGQAQTFLGDLLPVRVSVWEVGAVVLILVVLLVNFGLFQAPLHKWGLIYDPYNKAAKFWLSTITVVVCVAILVVLAYLSQKKKT